MYMIKIICNKIEILKTHRNCIVFPHIVQRSVSTSQFDCKFFADLYFRNSSRFRKVMEN